MNIYLNIFAELKKDDDMIFLNTNPNFTEKKKTGTSTFN